MHTRKWVEGLPISIKILIGCFISYAAGEILQINKLERSILRERYIVYEALFFTLIIIAFLWASKESTKKPAIIIAGIFFGFFASALTFLIEPIVSPPYSSVEIFTRIMIGNLLFSAFFSFGWLNGMFVGAFLFLFEKGDAK